MRIKALSIYKVNSNALFHVIPKINLWIKCYHYSFYGSQSLAILVNYDCILYTVLCTKIILECRIVTFEVYKYKNQNSFKLFFKNKEGIE